MVGRSDSSSSASSALDRRHLIVEPGMARVHDVHEDVRLGQLLERRLEGRHELMRELPDEADGVGEDERRVRRDRDQPRRRIERHEELVGGGAARRP